MMADFAVVERGAALARVLEARFGAAVDPQQNLGLLVIGPGVERLTQPLECGTVLLPGSRSGLLRHLRARSAVSYGLSPKDTITLSGCRQSRLWVAVQRELVRLDGTVLERQELVVEPPPGLDFLHALALTGAQLLLGTE